MMAKTKGRDELLDMRNERENREQENGLVERALTLLIRNRLVFP